MGDELLKIQLDYLKRRYDRLPEDMDQRLVAVREKEMFHFKALGQPCTVGPGGITLEGKPLTGPTGVLIALYVFHDKLRDFAPLGYPGIFILSFITNAISFIVGKILF